MNVPRESDLLAAQLDLVDLSASAIEDDCNPADDSDGVHQLSTASKGFCVKDFEEKMDNLKKENFNLKLRLYFLEQHSSLPDGIENFQKQYIELKSENETLSVDLKEKQDLLKQASIALELLEEEKLSEKSNADIVISELKNRVKALEQENSNLQQTVNDLNKSSHGNDTGYAEFIGAVDLRDVEMQRKMMEMTKMTEDYIQQIHKMNEEIHKFKNKLKDSESKLAAATYERDELHDKLKNIELDANSHQRKIVMFQEILKTRDQEKCFLECRNERLLRKNESLNEKCDGLELTNIHLSANMNELKNDLSEFKDKWATAECELLDVKSKLQESEEERHKTVKYLTQCLKTLNEEREKVLAMEQIVQQKKSCGIDRNDAKKDAEINALKMELDKMENKLKIITGTELKQKNQEIEELTNMLNKIRMNESSARPSETPRFSLEYLYESFNDLKFQQALEIKKQSQQKINELMHELVATTTAKTKEQVNRIKEQMAIVVEKQEIADNALSRCAELCSYTLDHLHELTVFLSTLLQNKDIRESLSNQSLIDIQSILDRSIEFSRYSIDGRMSALPDMSMLGNLINAARDSIASIREVSRADHAVQSEFNCDKCDSLEQRLQEFEEIKRVNQLLEDEICEYRGALQMREIEIKKCQDDLKFLKETEQEINNVLEDSKNTIDALKSDKIGLLSKLEVSQEIVKKLERRLKELEEDIDNNWVQKEEHKQVVNKIRDEVVNAEAQTAAIRLELEEIRTMYPKYKLNSTKSSLNSDDLKENVVSSNNLELEPVGEKKLIAVECNEENRQLVMASDCRNCPKYRTQIQELKKYLQACYVKLQTNAKQKAIFENSIQKQLTTTEEFLSQARSSMQSVLKSKENKENNIK